MVNPIWRNTEIREQMKIITKEASPDLVLTNATYLHGIFKKWVTGNIWIKGDRIVYAGQEMPKIGAATEVADMEGKFIVPGYIEPHVHPYQLYNPQTFADYAAQGGTTTFLSDNLTLFLALENEKAFSLLDKLAELPFNFYWWTRFDSQTELSNEDGLFTSKAVGEWLDRPDVLLGGELTGWPKLMAGDDQMLYWIQKAKLGLKKIEGHFPGASEKTLARMRLLGADGDHEAMTVEEVEMRLLHGYGVTLRHSSIRPDLPDLLKGIVERELNVFDKLMMTTDGSTPGFHKDGVMDLCIKIALEAGVPPIDAYMMASYNVARYYNVTNLHGLIATGRIANLNILDDIANPVPSGVISKGVWLKRNGEKVYTLPDIDWSVMPELNMEFELTEDDFQFSMPFGLEMVNDVITKPYSVSVDTHDGNLSKDHEESFLMLIDRHGKWRVNTLIKGFASGVSGFASSYTNTGDVILIGKNRRDMWAAFEELKRIKGGIVLMEDGTNVCTLPLPIGGGMSDLPMEQLIVQEAALKEALASRGYKHGDAVYTLLFLQATHLPYVRITQKGIYDVMNKKILFPAFMR
ncbi:adenine deaminase C-terminal domain-containing protein [Planococcus shenhongbingii]|uniref:adenine deaminase n=1 Tax=Planococcus shenhongbingii TaxID=3058398 RepID=A0ABT8NIU2_9BACL|nr:adenine deaminase C-terminal domain-containing protein [Planococcus sp. N017]MDN7247400.1 adenine deaminase C-terminal domain-containing protein [Planococcus sp. N017]